MLFRWTIAACIAAVLAGGAIASAEAKTCLVKKFRFENEGGYDVTPMWIVGTDASNVYDQRSGTIRSGESRTFDLSKTKNLTDGVEVWLEYGIGDIGDNDVSCRKDGTTLVYDSQKGNTWEYWAKGTTQNNNRCRFRNNKCIAP